ncbi:MAG: hypothetical protein ABIJ09_23225 [Pseudomonadota bacterium]
MCAVRIGRDGQRILDAAQRFEAQARVGSDDVKALVDLAQANARASAGERAALKQVLARYSDKLEPDARARLEGYLGMTSAAVRNLVHALEADDGVVDARDAGKLAELVTKDGRITSREKYSLGAALIAAKMTPEAAAAVRALQAGVRPGPALVALGTVGGLDIALHPAGYFGFAADRADAPTTGVAGTPHGSEALATRLYCGARLIAADPSLLARVDGAAQRQLVAHLVRAASHGGDVETSAPGSVASRKLRYGAAGVLAACVRSGVQREAAVDGLLGMVHNERDRPLLAFVYHQLAGATDLNPAQRSALDALKVRVLRQAPPYEGWFKDGNTQLNVRHYIHEEYWNLWVPEYRRLGFQETPQPGGAILFEREYKDPQGQNPPTRVSVLVHRTEKDIFRDMDDSKTHIEWYSGHSNLGGNVEYALRNGPAAASGDKWILNWMCRGFQVHSDVTRRYPDAHYTTTTISPAGGNGQLLIDEVFRGVAARASYADIRRGVEARDRQNPRGTYLFPDDPRTLALLDYDGDGKADAGPAGADPLLDAALNNPDRERWDLKPRPSTLDVDELRGEKVFHAVNFANTLVHYHNEYSPHRPGIGKAYDDHIVSGGWFDDGSDTPVRVQPRRVDGQDFFEVQVNARFADQSADAVGALVQYELFLHAVAEERGGSPTAEDRLRGLVFAGEYLSYMYCSWNEMDAVLRRLGERAGFAGVNAEKVRRAIDSDGSGYITDAQVAALGRILGV